MTHAMYPHVFAEGEIGAMTTRNRLVMSSMCDNMSGRQGEVTDQKVEYFRRKAQGGVGWINLGYSYVTQRGRGCTYYQSGIYEDELIPGQRRLTDAVQGEGARMGLPDRAGRPPRIAPADSSRWRRCEQALSGVRPSRRRGACRRGRATPRRCGPRAPCRWPGSRS